MDITTRTHYLAGPMSGIPQFNFPEFDRVTTRLRDRGYTVISPAELDRPEVREASMASLTGTPLHEFDDEADTWGDFLSRDVKLVADSCNSVILLPNWQGSKGARLEAFVAMQCGYPIFGYTEDLDPRGEGFFLVHLSYETILHIMTEVCKHGAKY